MKRITTTPRPDWQDRVTEYGLTFHTIDGETYWDESCYYRFTTEEVDVLDDATAELHKMCLETVEDIISRQAYDRFLIPPDFIPYIEKSWREQQESLYGRFDFCYDGTRPPKMLEYNADTPTALLEASVIQWFWLQDIEPTADQFNSIHERLLERLKEIQTSTWPLGNPIFYFASYSESEEDYITVNYLRDLAIQSGFTTEYLTIEDIGWDDGQRAFVDLDRREIKLIFKLYPWEWLMREEFAPYLLLETTRFIEPPWKSLLSNKALLPLLWERYPDHPNLLRAEWEPFGNTYVKKPILSREGANVTVVTGGQTLLESDGAYADWPCIYQEWSPLPNFDGNFAVIGSWVVGDTACGIGIREDNTLITRDTSRFVPHFFT